MGIAAAVPRDLLLRETGFDVQADQPLGVGVLFNQSEAETNEAALEACISTQGLRVLGWRTVPVDPGVLGEIALGSMPGIRHLLLTDDSGDPADTLERKLYLARKDFERRFERGEVTGYVASLSARVVVYKSLCIGRLLSEFYADLRDSSYVTPFALFHQRYATNTTPAWHRAQPGRMLAHNGEINTVWGNRSRMEARYTTLPAECQPILTKDGTDSTSLDETVELLTRNGRTVAEAIRILLPPAMTEHPSAFLQYHRDTAEPWDGPAALGFTDGRLVGAALDRNGLRPSRYAFTSDGLVVAGSEAGLVDLDPEKVVHSGRLGPGQMLVVDLQEQRIYENEELLDLFDQDGSYARLVDDRTIEAEWVDLPPRTWPALKPRKRTSATPAKTCAWSCSPCLQRARTPSGPWATTRRSPTLQRLRGRCTRTFASALRRSRTLPSTRCARLSSYRCTRALVRGRTCWTSTRRCPASPCVRLFFPSESLRRCVRADTPTVTRCVCANSTVSSPFTHRCRPAWKRSVPTPSPLCAKARRFCC